MTNILIYDTDAERLEKIVDKYGTMSCEVIEALLDAIEDETVNLEEYGFTKE